MRTTEGFVLTLPNVYKRINYLLKVCLAYNIFQTFFYMYKASKLYINRYI